MDLLLLKLVAFVRPLGGIKYAEVAFELISIVLIIALGAALLMRGATRHALRFSGIDALILAFTVWCLTIFVVYFESASFAELAKLLIPLLSYTIAKNIIANERQYRALLFWIILGFTIPAIGSAALILLGEGVQYVSYWTGVSRWEGAYIGSHNLGHSMTLLLITLVLFVEFFRRERNEEQGGRQNALTIPLCAFLGLVALYCLYMSQVRTALVGLIIFVVMYLYFRNKKYLIYSVAVIAVVATTTVPFWLPALLPEVAMRQPGAELDSDDLGSGRPRLWRNDLTVFAALPIDQKLAGVGIGSRVSEKTGQVLYGHNDWLEMLTQTGIVGVALFAMLQLLIFLAILRLPPERHRYPYLALFVSVNVMMVLSNSYAWRIQVGHLYYIILAFIELNQRQGVSMAIAPESQYPTPRLHGSPLRFKGGMR